MLVVPRSLAALVLTGTLALVTGCASAPSGRAAANDIAHGGWYRDVAGVAAATDNAGRRDYLRTRLQSMGLTVEAKPFESNGVVGENLFANVGGPADAPLLLLGAHSDRVEAGDGATDNGSGSAVILALAERLRARPLAHHRVKVALWDLEERGLLGSRAYVAAGDEKPALYVNFDVFGWGDSLWLMSLNRDLLLRAESEAAARAHGLAITSGEQYPPTDHLPFQKAGWPAISYSLVGRDEIPNILTVFSGGKPAQMPKVMSVIHTVKDTLQQLDETAAGRGVDAVEAALRAWDANTH